MKKALLLAGFAGMVAANAEAIDVTPYVGVDATYASMDSDRGSAVSSKNWAGDIVLGARTDHFGLEGYFENGLRDHRTLKPGKYTVRNRKFGIDALAFQQLGCSGRWEGIASAGLTFNRARIHHGGDVDNDNGRGERLGAGLQYAVTENMAVRAMYHYNWIHQSQVNNANEISLGVRYSF